VKPGTMPIWSAREGTVMQMHVNGHIVQDRQSGLSPQSHRWSRSSRQILFIFEKVAIIRQESFLSKIEILPQRRREVFFYLAVRGRQIKSLLSYQNIPFLQSYSQETQPWICFRGVRVYDPIAVSRLDHKNIP
jgi:hypothetical protein